MNKIITLFISIFLITNAFSQSKFDEMNKQYDNYRKTAEIDSALVIAKKMNKWAFEIEKDTSLHYAVSLRYIGRCYNLLNLNDSAFYYYQLSLKILRNQNRKTHLEYASCLNRLGILNAKLGNYVAAEPLFKEALEIRKKALGVEHADYALSLNNFGIFYYSMGNYVAAEPLFIEALEIRKKSLGVEHPDYASSLNNVGNLYIRKGDYRAAEPFFIEALEIKKKVFGVEHPDYALSLNNLGLLYSDMGNFEAAEPLLKESLEIRKKAIGVEPLDYATGLHSLGGLYQAMGNHAAAESLYKEAIEITKRSLGVDHSGNVIPVNNLGNLYAEMGNYPAAGHFYKEALEIIKKAFGVEHPYYLSILNNMGLLYHYTGNYPAAEPLYKKVLEIRKKTLGVEHPDYASNLNNLGLLYSDMGNFVAAEPLLKESLEIRKKVFGVEHPDYALGLSNLGILYKRMGNYASAEPLCKEALGIIIKKFNSSHPLHLEYSNSLADLYSRTNRFKEAYKIYQRNVEINKKNIADNFEWLTDIEKEAYWEKESAFYDNLSLFSSRSHQVIPEAVALNYNVALFTKNKLLETKISKESYYNDINNLREELRYRRKLLIKMESDGSDNKEKINELRHQADSLDKLLTMSWPAYAEQKRNLSITWDQVKENLAKGEAAIEFVRFRVHEDSVYQYQALIIRKDKEWPSLVPLCTEDDLKNIPPKSGFSAYYPLVWKPLEKQIKDIITIYYAPSGELYNVPFHALYKQKGNGDENIPAKVSKRGVILQEEQTISEEVANYLLDQYSLHQLTSTRYLAMNLKKKEKAPLNKSLALIGGIDYNALPGDAIKSNKKKGKNYAASSSSDASGKLDYLEGTQDEIDAIEKSTVSDTWEVISFEGSRATEENVIKQEDKEAKGVLHIATHGYAFEQGDADSTVNKNSLHYNYRFSENPMVRSGLILAGGNWAWTGSDTLSKLGAEQNGILTALEVSQLKLRKTKLVVLSACETGLGKIEGSEGTFGLKRGFKLAGVEQMIVSLWSVPDKETVELMTLFYEDLSKSLNPVISFEKAQKEMRNKYPLRPDLWAGFVLVR